MDLGLHADVQESYRIFQSRILLEYEKLVSEYGLHVMDAQQPVEVQQRLLRQTVMQHIMGVRRGVA